MAIRKNKKQPINKRSRVKNSTITDLSDFDPETTIVFDGYADFAKYRKITDLGNLQIIKGGADFSDSQVQDLGNLQTIGGNALFSFSQVQDLGNLQTIGGSAFFGSSKVKRLGNLQTIGGRAYFGISTDLEAEWEQRQEGYDYAEGGGVGDVYTLKDKDDTWYLTYIDSTHFFLSNTKEYKGSAYHIGQFRTRPFYNEVLSWLKSHKGQQSYAKGGGVDMYSKFDFNEKGNLSARINQKNYEIEYNDADGVYELFENGERVQSNKNVRTLTQFIQVSDVGNFREGQSVMIAEDNDNENYDDFRGKELVIYHKATNEKEHRGFDNSMEGQALYSFFLRETGEQVPFSCYDYELEQY